MSKIAPSNPLLLKGGRGAILHSYKIAKNTYFALLRATDIKGFKGINLGKKESKTKLLPRHKHLNQLHNNYYKYAGRHQLPSYLLHHQDMLLEEGKEDYL